MTMTLDMTTNKGKLILAAIVAAAFYIGTNFADVVPWMQVSLAGHCKGLEGKSLPVAELNWFRQNCLPPAK
jgi:hypothetical protein